MAIMHLTSGACSCISVFGNYTIYLADLWIWWPYATVKQKAKSLKHSEPGEIFSVWLCTHKAKKCYSLSTNMDLKCQTKVKVHQRR